MAEAFRTNISLRNEEAEAFMRTMVVATPKEMLISPAELSEMREIAKKLGLGSI